MCLLMSYLYPYRQGQALPLPSMIRPLWLAGWSVGAIPCGCPASYWVINNADVVAGQAQGTAPTVINNADVVVNRAPPERCPGRSAQTEPAGIHPRSS